MRRNCSETSARDRGRIAAQSLAFEVGDHDLEISQRKAQGTGTVDEHQPIHIGAGILPVACAVPGCWRQHAHFLVTVNGFGCRARRSGELADGQHRIHPLMNSGVRADTFQSREGQHPVRLRLDVIKRCSTAKCATPKAADPLPFQHRHLERSRLSRYGNVVSGCGRSQKQLRWPAGWPHDADIQREVPWVVR
jgi:hypothetical protein